MTDKYELTDNKTVVSYCTLHQIRALKDFGDVKRGDLGGWVESYNNLSQTGLAWIYSGAVVYDSARVFGNAQVYGNAMVYDNAWVYDDAQINDHAQIYGNARVYDHACVYDNAQVSNNAIVCDDAWIHNYVQIYGSATVCGDAQVYDNAQVYGGATICGSTIVSDNAKVYGNSYIQGKINIRENDVIDNYDSYLIFNNTWSSGREFIYILSNHRWHVGCFDGTGGELIKKAYADSELSGKMYESYVRFAENLVKARQRNEDKNSVQ